MKKEEPQTLGEWVASFLGPPSLELRPERLDIFARWNLSRGDHASTAISDRLDEAWREWPEPHQELLLQTAESIATAENAKARWNPKDRATRRKYEQTAKDALAAARLARGIASRLSPSRDAESAMKDLVSNLAAFASASLSASALSDAHLAVARARAMLDEVRRRETANPASNQLIADLAWLASGKSTKEPLNESTLRRYGTGQQSHTPAARYWRRGWELMREAGRLSPTSQREKFIDEIERVFFSRQSR